MQRGAADGASRETARPASGSRMGRSAVRCTGRPSASLVGRPAVLPSGESRAGPVARIQAGRPRARVSPYSSGPAPQGYPPWRPSRPPPPWSPARCAEARCAPVFPDALRRVWPTPGRRAPGPRCPTRRRAERWPPADRPLRSDRARHSLRRPRCRPGLRARSGAHWPPRTAWQPAGGRTEMPRAARCARPC